MKTQTPQWFKEFENKFNDEIKDFRNEFNDFKTNQEKFNVRLEKRIDNLVSKNKLVE